MVVEGGLAKLGGGGGGSVCSNNTIAFFNTTAHTAVFMTTLTTCGCSTYLFISVLDATSCTVAQACSIMSILFNSFQSDGCLLFVIVHTGQYLWAGGS